MRNFYLKIPVDQFEPESKEFILFLSLYEFVTFSLKTHNDTDIIDHSAIMFQS